MQALQEASPVFDPTVLCQLAHWEGCPLLFMPHLARLVRPVPVYAAMSASPSPPDGALASLAAPRSLPLALGVGTGVLAAVVVTLADARSSAVVHWLLRLPGGLFLNAIAALTLPIVVLHATLTGAKVAHDTANVKAQQRRWLRIGAASLGVFAASTLFASALGASVALTLRSIVPSSEMLALAWGLPSGATVAFSCPGDIANGSLSLQSDGKLVCSKNVSTFVLDDVARTFVVKSQTTAGSVGEQLLTVVESVFLANVAGGFQAGDVLGLVVGGLALGIALVCYTAVEEGEPPNQEEGERNQAAEDEQEEEIEVMLLQLVAHAETALCSVLQWIHKYLPFGAAFMTASVLVYASSTEDAHIGALAAAVLALVAVLLLALVLDVVAMLTLATILTQSNPFGFLKYVVSAQLMALGSGSPLIALPTTVSSVIATKSVSSPLAFVLCTASTVLNQTGTAIYISVSTLFVLTASGSGMNSSEFGNAESASNIMAMVFANVILASVVSPLPGSSKTAALATSLGDIFGVPIGTRTVLLAFLAGLEWITDPLVACVNVTNNALVALVISHYFEDNSTSRALVEPDDSEAPTRETTTPDVREQTLVSDESVQILTSDQRGITLASINSQNWV